MCPANWASFTFLKISKQAAEESGIDCEIVKVTDIVEMLAFNPIGLPALAIDGQLKVARRVPESAEIVDGGPKRRRRALENGGTG